MINITTNKNLHLQLLQILQSCKHLGINNLQPVAIHIPVRDILKITFPIHTIHMIQMHELHFFVLNNYINCTLRTPSSLTVF